MDKSLCGVIIPVGTPFVEDDLSLEGLTANIEKWNPTKIRGYMVLGSNGESRSLSDEEAEQVVKTTVAKRSKDKLVMAGVTKESLKVAADFANRMADAGADYVSVLTPHYFASAMTDVALANYYNKLADRSRIPVFIYCAPRFSNGVTMSVAALKMVADHPNIKGIKDTSSNMMADYCNALSGRDDFTIYAGSIKNIMQGLQMGAAGGVISSANYIPEKCAEITELFFSGKVEESVAYHQKILSLTDRTASKYGVAGLKACMDIMGYAGGVPRLPVLGVTEEQKAEMAAILKAEC